MSDDPKPYAFQTKDGHGFSGIGGKMHSVNDEPAVVYADGTKWWYRENKIHRDNGPAVVHPNGVEEWWQDGKRHRADGPAVIYPETDAIPDDMRGVKQYWENGQLVKIECPDKLAAYHAELSSITIELRRRHGLPT